MAPSAPNSSVDPNSTAVFTSVCTKALSAKCMFLAPDVFLDGSLVTAAGLPVPQQGDMVTYTKEPHECGRNHWRVTRVLSVKTNAGGRAATTNSPVPAPNPPKPATDSAPDAEMEVVRRLTARLATGPRTTNFLEQFLADPAEGGSAAHRATVADWRAFAARYAGLFWYTAAGPQPKLGLAVSAGRPLPTSAATVTTENPPTGPPSTPLPTQPVGPLCPPETPPLEAPTPTARTNGSPNPAAPEPPKPSEATVPPVPPPQPPAVPPPTSASQNGARASNPPARQTGLAAADTPTVTGNWHTTPDGQPFEYVTDNDGLARARSELRLLYKDCLDGVAQPACRHLALDCEGVPEELLLLQLATPERTYVFDTLKLGPEVVCKAVRPFLECRHLHKVAHDVHQDAVTLRRFGIHLAGLLDTQLAYEFLKGELHCGLSAVLQLCGQQHPTKQEVVSKMRRMADEDVAEMWRARPLDPRHLQYAALDVASLAPCYPRLVARLGDHLDLIVRASDLRAKYTSMTGDGRRLVGFDKRTNHRLASYELLAAQGPDRAEKAPAVTVDGSEARTLLRLLPAPFQAALTPLAHTVTDINLDVGRRPEAYCSYDHRFLAEDEAVVVTAEHINAVVVALGGPAQFGADNRAALAGSLHRVSAIRNRVGDIAGLTLRMGRPIGGLAFLLSDVLLGMRDRSVLFLGEPGSGKTSAIRDAAAMLSQRCNVVVVDTSNEIGGDGDLPHPCLGRARRMMVPALDRQAAVMVECVQNHCPHVMVVDEIGREAEVDAARTVKNRGVRMIASAHGSLRQLMRNRPLRGLLGSFEHVILPKGIPCTKRTSEPTFDCIVELSRGAPNEWVVVLNVAEEVDRLLQGKPYRRHRRSRDPATGMVRYDILSD